MNRGNGRELDFTPILTHYLFLFTTILAVAGWFVAFIGQCISAARFAPNHDIVGTQWFGIFLQLFLILGVLYTLASDSIAMHRLQICVFGAVAIVYAVEGVQKGIYSTDGALNAMSAGWLILSLVDILWVLYFTSEDDSLTLHLFNSMGTGGLTPPSRRRRTRTANSVHNMSTANGNYATNYASGGIGSDMYNSKAGSGMVAGAGGYGAPGGVRSTGSFTSGDARDKSMGGGGGSIHNATSTTGPGSLNEPNAPGSPIGAGVAGIGGGNNLPLSDPASADAPAHKAKALYAYTASPDDPNELTFNKGDILDIIDKQGKWWSARRTDGTTGIAPSNYLQLL
ncbi:hypothetical protein CPB85DRAFT_1209804 [Mucidula mucida]|nr:hypothetical protein CPB85DRAFT_1209804 [Mucidula mucida]